MSRRAQLAKSRRWVVKIGSALLTDDGRGLDKKAISGWVSQLVKLRGRGVDLILVSSGSVAEGIKRLHWKTRPHAIHALQAAAAVGQMGLVQVYESYFRKHGIHTAQILLTHDDLSRRDRYLNARSTLCTLLRMGVVPVVNENDTVATEEIMLGDNDTLAGLVANLVEAELLVILTDQSGLYRTDPRVDPDAALIREGQSDDPELENLAGGSGALGRGGMRTKVRAAALAARSGAATIIVSGREPEVLLKISAGEVVGTLLNPARPPLAARKRWLAGHLKVRGKLTLDAGASQVLSRLGRSLLAVGVTAVSGRFVRGELVACIDQEGREIARGLVNYSDSDTRRIKGHPSDRIEELLGYVYEPELIHRDNLVLVD